MAVKPAVDFDFGFTAMDADELEAVQTVKEDENEEFFKLISKFYELSGVPVLLNTSFNENEPIVLNPEQAIDCFVRTNMDFLVIENWTISR